MLTRSRKWPISRVGSSNTKVYFKINGASNGTNVVDLVNGGKGQVFKLTSTTSVEFEGYLTSSNTVEKKISLTVSTPTTTVIYSTKFQPEDRYGYIGTTSNMYDTNGTSNTTDNFVKVVNNVSSLTDLHIKFFTDSAGSTRADVTTGVTGQSFPTNGIKLKPDTVSTTYPAIDSTQYTPVGDGTAASPYLVRLPKNAKYAQLYNGSTAVGSIIALADDSGKTGGITLTVSGDSSSQTVSKSYASRGGTDIQVNAKKTDIDYIFFTDSGSTKLGSNIRAYYFGDADGEFSQWPGVAPSYSYIDNGGKTVYAFQYPTVANSTAKAYPYVIFNGGGAYSTTTMTTAQSYSGSENYSISSGTTQYGVDGSSNAINAVNISGTRKTTDTTVNYTTTNKYIFFVNNGTYNFGQSGNTRYLLDDVHITFFDFNHNELDTDSPGYVMDKIGTYNKDGTSGDLYRIAIPSNAQYFQINNGTAKGGGNTKYNLRNSVIEEVKQNGIYKFVDNSTDAADVWDGSATASSVGELDDHNYKLKLINQKTIESEDEEIPESVTYDVHLATVETKDGTANSDGGNIKRIIWLKPAVGHENDDPQTTVDTNYLDYDGVDIAALLTNNTESTVKVKKLGTYYWVETTPPEGYQIKTGETGQKSFTISAYGSSPDISTVKFVNEIKTTPTNQVILTKTAKEKVGSTEIGATLSGAKFLLYNASDDTLAGGFNLNNGEYNYVTSGGVYNTVANDSSKYMATGIDQSDSTHYGKLILNGLPLGDYYLKEMSPPQGYSEIDSNTGTNKCVYFSIGDNTVTKEITFSDEMAPAYIKLYEHINEKLPAWGDPTFIFKITNTTSGKTSIVALTVDDNGGLAANAHDTVLSTSDNSYAYDAYKYIESTDEMEGESPQKLEYQGMYHIDNQGRIRLEPGTYTITRVPVSRYEFVADTWKLEDDTTANIYTTNKHTETNQTMTGSEPAIQNVTIPQGETALVHYYDKVAYYDKFSHVDEEINKFYTLDASKNNITAKGIRVEFNGKADTSGIATIYTAQDNSTAANTFNAWFINVDGTEREMTVAQKEKLEIEIPGGLPSDFEYISTNHTLSINNAQSYANNVYTLTAVYKDGSTDLFETTFDLVFARS